MKVGDLVRWTFDPEAAIGVVLRVFEHKLWRTEDRGKKVNFASIDAEPFAEVLVAGSARNIPQSDLEVVSASDHIT